MQMTPFHDRQRNETRGISRQERKRKWKVKTEHRLKEDRMYEN